ncbi:Helicase conserved C-terminal domain protein [uncultured Desulfobacterium sp.]|uniref:Helicase conserved C-terminal domain protein n=1 Tax=uncultured Desulfobacterium sp. TaxID=201089 RepID=A0A445MZ52_9BACT|nr:Helicase conserved C-terminal domain protein [uncultured Desulfobacterium sp.]
MHDSTTSGIKDNYLHGSAGDFVLKSIVPESKLSFVSAYFTIHAFEALRAELESIHSLRFLFGEPRFVRNLDHENKQSRRYNLTEKGLFLGNQLSQRRLAKDCADWIRRKVEIRSITRTSFLHGKLYHIQDGNVAHAMVGSSNFTVPGLGLHPNGNNIELNLVVTDDRDRTALLSWFNNLWNDTELVEDVKDTVIKELGRLYENQSPQFIYYLTLFNIFREFLDGTRDIDESLRRTAIPDTRIWQTLFSFQKDGAKAAINKILACNGCILADSVGLGKTYTALAVIKFFELRNERVLVLCPKKLRRNWTVFRANSSLNPFLADRFRYDVLSHTDLSRDRGDVDGIDLASLNWGNYDLVVIDESHNFRNNSLARQRPGEKPRQSRYQRLISDIITSGVNTKVLLLSATPVNNQLADLRNQISFIAGGDVARDDRADAAFGESLGIESVRETSRKAQTNFTNWAKKPAGERKTRDLLSALGGDFFKLLDGLSIARSRSQIASYYKEEMRRLGGFPRRTTPRSLHPPIDLQQHFLSFEQLDHEISELNLALYHPTARLREDLPQEIRTMYLDTILGGFTQEGRERILIAMMKVNLLKRLESSVDSFRLTLQRTIEKIDRLKERILAFEKHVDENPEIDYDILTPDQFEDPDFDTEEFTIGGKRRIHLGHLKLPEWLKEVRQDRVQLQFLLEKTSAVKPDRDGKLAELRTLIGRKVKDPSVNRDGKTNRKVLVFTAFADTARYLYDQLDLWAQTHLNIHTALILGDGSNRTSLGNADYDDILTNFSPLSKSRSAQPRFPQTEEIDLLIATDCISEGQNLQDCDLLINYDIHWNPVRIIQRFGRIDRIGSRNSEVHLVNFWPVADLDRYLNVKHRVEARMALVDLSATQTDNLLNPGQLKELIKEDLLFRNRQLRRLKNEVLDLEDFDDAVSLTDFSLDEFRLDLLQFIESRRAELEEAGRGLYAVVQPRADIPACRPGAIFCLRFGKDTGIQKDQGGNEAQPTDSAKINPLSPYYLVYVHDDGTVRFSFAQPKESLLLMRGIAAGETAPLIQLCDLFDAATKEGSDMSHYNSLIQKALASIQHTFRRRAAAALLSGRGGMLPTAAETPAQDQGDFELITWLVIMQPKQE